MVLQLRKMNRKTKNRCIIKYLLEGNNYTATAKKLDSNSQTVKIIFFREMEKILSVNEWELWLLSDQSEFKDLKLFQFHDREKFILERMKYCGW